jgi:predicted  nucleic acid-binding Zn-ribbon protein
MSSSDHQTALTRCHLEIAAKDKEIAALKDKIAAYEKALSMDTPYRDQATALSAARIEIAALKAELAEANDELHKVRMNWDAELARYTGPLTDEQWKAAYAAVTWGYDGLSDIDAAIRAAREGAR